MKYAHAILIVDGRYVLQLRDSNAPEGAGTWGMFGGRIEPGENAIAAVQREIMEELELWLDSPRYLFTRDPWTLYVADVTEQWPRHVCHEGERAGLFSFEEVAGIKRAKIVDDALAEHRRRMVPA